MGADGLPRFLPMPTTAAGTIKPAQVLVLGAGVAGLQAIATARRLGAVVYGFDVRPVVREQGPAPRAKVLAPRVRGGETEGGGARGRGEERRAQQQTELESRPPRFGPVITPAPVPGRPAPKLIPA